MSEETYSQQNPPEQPAPEAAPSAGTSAAPPPAAPSSPEQPKRKGGCGRGCGLVAVAIIGAIVGSLIASTFVPWALGIPPWKLLDRQFIQRVLGGSSAQTIVKNITTTGTTDQPVVAVAAKVSSSVVFISTTQTQSDIFGRQTVQGEGSGVIYRSDGYIITNNHVVAGAQKIFVTIDGAAPIAGEVKGTDPQSDLAVVKVDKTGLPAADLADSDDLVVGQLAVAVGAPFGLEKTVTSGVISALHRNTVAQNEMGQTVTYANLIQTDAPINPGNSGGALANDKGQVMGINTLIRSPSGASAGIGFAIPIDFVKKIAKLLVAGKTVGHAYIGVFPAPVTTTGPHTVPGVQEGALVARLVPNGPAAKGGLKVGDVIVGIGGSAIKTVEDLFAIVREHQPGDKVEVAFIRNGKRETAAVTLGAQPKPTPPKAGPTR